MCLRNFRIAATLLIKCAQADMTLADISSILYKEDPDDVAPIEELVKKAEAITEIMRNSVNKDFLRALEELEKQHSLVRESVKEGIQFLFPLLTPSSGQKALNDEALTLSPDILSDITANLNVTKQNSEDFGKSGVEFKEEEEDDSENKNSRLESDGRVKLTRLERIASMPNLHSVYWVI